MLVSDLDYTLPEELIAQFPLPERDASRLLLLERKTKAISHKRFLDLANLLEPGDLLVFNESKVIPSRLLGRRATGGAVECFVVEIIGDREAWCLIKSSAKKSGLTFFFDALNSAEVVGREPDSNRFRVRFSCPLLPLMASLGQTPLPPYITRGPSPEDSDRYQTIYAANGGSVAAPTAGLHFTKRVFAGLAARGVETAFVTLHVGLGTFLPIQAEDLNAHKMHSEQIDISAATASKLLEAKKQGRRVIAVGTTSARTLESYYRLGQPGAAFQGSTQLFLKPGDEFLCINGLLTNFHQPRSTLIALLGAFAGLELVKTAYDEAIQKKYRFLSYGDCMLVL